MKSVVGIILFLFGVHLTIAQELFIHNESASSTPKGVLGVRLFGNSFNEIDVRRNMFALRWMYGVTPKLSLYIKSYKQNHIGELFFSHISFLYSLQGHCPVVFPAVCA